MTTFNRADFMRYSFANIVDPPTVSSIQPYFLFWVRRRTHLAENWAAVGEIVRSPKQLRSEFEVPGSDGKTHATLFRWRSDDSGDFPNHTVGLA